MNRRTRPVLPPVLAEPIQLMIDRMTARHICGSAAKLDELVDAAHDPAENAPAVLHFIRVEGLGLMQLVRVWWGRGAVDYRYAIAGRSKGNAEKVVKLVSEGQRGLLIGMTPFPDPKLKQKGDDQGDANAMAVSRAIASSTEVHATA